MDHQHLLTSTDIFLRGLSCFSMHWVTNCAYQIPLTLTLTDISLAAWDVFECFKSQIVHLNGYRHPQTCSWNLKMLFNVLSHKLCLIASTDIFLEAWDVFQASLQGVESSHQSHKGTQYTIAEGMSVSFVRKGFPTRSHDMTTSPTGFLKMLCNILFTLWTLFLRWWNKP